MCFFLCNKRLSDRWQWKCSKCCWTKKQIELLRIHNQWVFVFFMMLITISLQYIVSPLLGKLGRNSLKILQEKATTYTDLKPCRCYPDWRCNTQVSLLASHPISSVKFLYLTYVIIFCLFKCIDHLFVTGEHEQWMQTLNVGAKLGRKLHDFVEI